MNNIFISGSTGFVGTNLTDFFNSEYIIFRYLKDTPVVIEQNIVLHLAGKAQDLKNITNPDEYYKVNTELTIKVFDAFLASEAKVFITLSSVKAVADEVQGVLNEEHRPCPISHYGKSKLLAERYILSKDIPEDKRVYILRPCMIHGPGNKGNLNLLYKLVSSGIPWPLGSFENERSFCSIENLMFIFKELIERQDIPSGLYNVADDVPLSTNEVIKILAASQNRKPRIWSISKSLIQIIAKIGSLLKLPINEERLKKLTFSYVISNKKLVNSIGKPLPVSSREGLLKTFQSYQ